MHVSSRKAYGKGNLEKRNLVQDILRALPVAAVGFLRRRPSRRFDVEVIREKMWVTHFCKDWKTCCNGHVVCMEDSRWPKRVMTWSPDGRRRVRPKVKCEKEVERVGGL